MNDAGRITLWEELLVTAITDTQLTTVTNTVNSYTSPEVMPARRAILSASQSIRGHTDSVEDMTITARLIAEDEKVVPRRTIPLVPTLTYKLYEVFDPTEWQSHDWTELRDYEVTRQREEVDFDLGAFSVESDAIGASESFTYRMTLEGRSMQAAILGWLYARAGSLHYLWVPTMQRDFEIVSSVSDELTVAGHNYFDNYTDSEFRRDIAFVYNDNTLALRRIESVALDGVNEVLTLDASVPVLTNLRSVSYLLFCRLDNDTVEIARATDSKARFSWMFREVLSSPE